MGRRFVSWLGAGVVVAGVSATMIAGAAVAAADTGPSHSSSAHTSGASTKPNAGQRVSHKPPTHHPQRIGTGTGSRPRSIVGHSITHDIAERDTARPPSRKSTAQRDQPKPTSLDPTVEESADKHGTSALGSAPVSARHRVGQPDAHIGRAFSGSTEGVVKGMVDRIREVADRSIGAGMADKFVAKPAMPTAASATDVAQPASQPVVARAESIDGVATAVADRITAQVKAVAAPVAATAAAPQQRSVLDLIGSAFFAVYSAALKAVEGPPALPPGSTVTVRSSTLDLGDGHTVEADWYYPASDEPPTRLIYLQHGFFANGAMYSYTAAYLAEGTDSIVVAPTLSLDPFEPDGMWLNGDPMQWAVADLFVGDRTALTDSALSAGYADVYGLDPSDANLPQKFVLMGHSAGGGLVSGAAGYAVDNGAAADLAGVILLDGVPSGDDVVPTALAKLPDDIPVYAIGAPPNLFNSSSNVNEALTTARPGQFNGVVVNGGVHMDSMLGGNALVQAVAELVAGIPQPQNPPAVRELAIGWINDMFDGTHGHGSYGAPGSTIEISTPDGTATAVVLGSASPAADAPGGLSAAYPQVSQVIDLGRMST